MKTRFLVPCASRQIHRRAPAGFALVVTLSLLVLLTIIAVGLLSLSSISLRSSTQASAQSEARANARMALMIALGELQKEMGPDMRVSAESAVFDSDPATQEIEGVPQSHWLASYNAWGDWLNARYDLGGSPLAISETYTPKRERMFRRWLLSLPPGRESDIDAPGLSAGWGDSDSVELVGAGSLGGGAASDQLTRAWLMPVGETGRHAWWIGPENHKAAIDKAKNPRNLAADAWQASSGNTAEVGVGAVDGLGALDSDPSLSDRLISLQTLRPATVAEPDLQRHFFDLTAESSGVLASVRTGSLKKDLSLLFEKGNAELPEPYKFIAGKDQEPSIRPMSKELLAKNPKIPIRHFASWTNMRHYHRMYHRQPSDANPGGTAGTGGSGKLNWSGNTPWTNTVARSTYDNYAGWNGSNNYWRMPLVAKVTFIYSLLTEPATATTHRIYLVYTPVFTFWNPYNTELRLNDSSMRVLTGAYQVLPLKRILYLNNSISSVTGGFGGANISSHVRGPGNSTIVFEPGELKVFSNKTYGSGFDQEMSPGFNPQGINGGDKILVGTYAPSQNPGLALFFGHPGSSFNINNGNTPGSLTLIKDWPGGGRMPVMYQHDWFQKAQQFTPISMPTGAPEVVGGMATAPQNIERWIFDGTVHPIAYAQLVLKTASAFDHPSIAPGNPTPHNWAKDWRSRNWIQAPPFYNGSAMYMSEDAGIAHTQRMDDPYMMNFGPLSNLGEAVALVDPFGDTSKAVLGSGPSALERIGHVPVTELPTSPVGSIAGFSGMKITPGWSDASKYSQFVPQLKMGGLSGQSTSTREASFYRTEVKAIAYQSGVTGPGIGNSFLHPVLPRDDVYRYFDNSKSQDPYWRNQMDPNDPAHEFQENDNTIFSDYWDHSFLLNDALWDDYFVSSLADQSRPGAGSALSLADNIKRLAEGGEPSNSRYVLHSGGKTPDAVRAELEAGDGYLKAAANLMVDGMFNVNSTSVAAWFSVFAGIRERQLVFRNNSGAVETIDVPSGLRIALSRFDTEVSGEEMDDPESGAQMPDGTPGWSGVRFLDDSQLRKLAEECVKQVKKRGPFLNFAEFINRRLSNDELGVMGALQSAIDYDDASPDPASINYRFKSDPDYRITASDPLHRYLTPEAAVGSRFAGIPGYVIQSDLLKPIANTLSVRDDTFRIRAYGESLDRSGKVVARSWCEAIVQRVPEYCDAINDPSVPARNMSTDGSFSDNTELTDGNRRFGRKFEIRSFRWLHPSEV